VFLDLLATVLGIFVLMEWQFYGNESSWNVRSRGTKVPPERMFHGMKVLGTFAHEEQKFHRSEISKERMFHRTKVTRERKFSLWTFRSRERKCRGTKRPTFANAYASYHFNSELAKGEYNVSSKTQADKLYTGKKTKCHWMWWYSICKTGTGGVST